MTSEERFRGYKTGVEERIEVGEGLAPRDKVKHENHLEIHRV